MAVKYYSCKPCSPVSRIMFSVILATIAAATFVNYMYACLINLIASLGRGTKKQ